MSIWNAENEHVSCSKNFGIAGSIGILALDCIIGGLIGGMIVIIRIINTVMEIIKLISGTFGDNVQKCE